MDNVFQNFAVKSSQGAEEEENLGKDPNSMNLNTNSALISDNSFRKEAVGGGASGEEKGLGG